MVGFLIIHICETFVKHETKISGSNQPLINTIKVNDQFSEGRFVDFLPSSSSNFFLRFWMWEIPSVRIVRMMSHNVDLQLVDIVASFLFVRSYFRGL